MFIKSKETNKVYFTQISGLIFLTNVSEFLLSLFRLKMKNLSRDKGKKTDSDVASELSEF